MSEFPGLWPKPPKPTWYHRRKIPDDLRGKLKSEFPGGVVFIALGTSDKGIAERRNGYAADFTAALFERVRKGGKPTTREEVQQFSETLRRTGRPPEEVPIPWLIKASEAEPRAWKWFNSVGRTLPTRPSADRVQASVVAWLEQNRVTTRYFENGDTIKDVIDWEDDLPAEITRYALDILDDRDRPGAETVDDLTSLLNQLHDKPETWWATGPLDALYESLSGIQIVVSKRISKRIRRRATPEEMMTPTISQALPRWKNRIEGTPNAKSAAEAERAEALWNTLAGDLPLGTVDRKTAKAFVEELRRLPDMRRKPFANMGIKEAIELADRLEIDRSQRISSSSVTKFVSLLRAVAEHAVDAGEISINPFHKLVKKPHVADQKKSLPFKPIEMKKFLSSPIFSGCEAIKPLRQRWKPGEIIHQDALYWLLIMAPYTGCRREEIGQLRVIDFEMENGIHFFQVTFSEDNNLKTAASQRAVPIHPVLLRAGLLDYVELRRKSGKEYLFDLTRNQLESLTSSIGSDLNDYLEGIGLKHPRKTFRSFRSTAISTASLVSDDLRRAVFGHESHERGDSHAVHYLEHSLEARFDAIMSITYPVDPSNFLKGNRKSIDHLTVI